MTSAEIRQSFLDFFQSKQHTIVPSSSLLPDAPNLLFTNAGMNQFVPVFLGQQRPDVDKWPGAVPALPTRAADTQKCIRAGGKHNDLDDVGLDTYHHTFFEMLGNWSFGDYFKQEAIEWAWELVAGRWKFPAQRLYATVYQPGSGDPAEFDQEAYDHWARLFAAAGLDPQVHIVHGGKKDNFWMMGDTGPCGPCSEIHVDLTPAGDTKGSLVNQGDARCIEIWNLVFIQLNANPDGTFSPLPAKHVDTGMGFERVTSIIQGTRGFTDFANAKISNYETDIFRPIFDELEKLSGRKYNSTLPQREGSAGAGTDRIALGEGGTGDPPVAVGNLPTALSVSRSMPAAAGATYSRRNLPHFEKPWAIYHIIINTIPSRQLSPEGRDVVFDCILHWRENRYRLVAACVMPDHAHFILQPGVKEEDRDGNPIFWPLSDILHSIKSFSAKVVNKLEGTTGTLWQEERFDPYTLSDADLHEKFHYLCHNPWAAGLVGENELWPWLWTPDIEAWKPYVSISQRKGGPNEPALVQGRASAVSSTTGDSPVATGNLPTSQTAGQVARQDGPVARSTQEQVALDIAFRVIADHIRTLSFAIADGIQPSNDGRGYVLRRILRRAVRYGRTLGFHEPFFYKLVDVLTDTMGQVFPEIRTKKQHVQEVIHTEEVAFNKTLDKGIALFEEEVAKLLGSAPASGAADRALAVGTGASEIPAARYSKRRLPHFERPWGKYMVTFSTRQHRQLAPAERDIVLESFLYAHNHRQYQLYAACVMPDHVHLLFEPQIKEEDKEGKPVFWSLGEILHGIKSTTAHRINKAAKVTGIHVWEEESRDRLIRGDSDLEEKFHYICRNPWDNRLVPLTEDYRWLWTPEAPTSVAGGAPATAPEAGALPEGSRGGAGTGARGGRAPQISGAVAFRLYDEQGFPFDLTELMARERELTVDKAGFEKLMDEQKARARAAQRKEVISLSQIDTTTPTEFVGYDKLETPAKVLEIVSVKDKTAVILDTSVCYAEMGGQVGDAGELSHGGQLWRIGNTQKSGNTWLHVLAEDRVERATGPSGEATRFADPVGGSPTGTGESPVLPVPGDNVTVSVDRPRRAAIQRHHTVTHLFHWALHEVVSKGATQKGSYVGPEKLTFDFNSAPLTPQQIADIEKLVNERILENAGVSWTEVAYADVKTRKDVLQFFGEKYGDRVRVVQIGGRPMALDGYSMELCGGTHTRATGEIGLFRIVAESAIAAGVRRVEAVAGLEAYRKANDELHLIKTLAGQVNSPVADLGKKIEAMLAHQKELEKQVKIAMQRNASNAASELLGRAQTVNGIPLITHNLGDADSDFLQNIADALKGRFKGVVVLGGCANNAVTLVATVSPEFTAKVQAGKIIQRIAPIVGGKGGGRPDNARGGGKDASKLDEALKEAKALLGS